MAIIKLTEGNVASGLDITHIFSEMMTDNQARQEEPVMPRASLSLYYRLELVETCSTAQNGLFIRLKIPTAGRVSLYQNYRSASVSHPIHSIGTATIYDLRSNLLLTTDERRVFVELTMPDLVAQCSFSGRVWLCKHFFLWKKLTKDDYLTKLFLWRHSDSLQTYPAQ